VTVTRSKRPWMPAYIGPPLFRVGGHLYGGILDRVIADGVDPFASNVQAQRVADEHNASADLCFPNPNPNPKKTPDE